MWEIHLWGNCPYEKFRNSELLSYWCEYHIILYFITYLGKCCRVNLPLLLFLTENSYGELLRSKRQDQPQSIAGHMNDKPHKGLLQK